jgi:hypothetical protein
MWQQWEDEKQQASYERAARAEAERAQHRQRKILQQETTTAHAAEDHYAEVSVVHTANVTNR